QDQIKHILQDVSCLMDLSIEHINRLRGVTEAPFAIDKFQVSMADYCEWLSILGDDIRGIELDGQRQRLVFKECPGAMHEIAVDVVREFLLQPLRDRLNAVTQSHHSLMGSKMTLLYNGHDSSFKLPDASLKHSESDPPIVVLEDAFAETTRDLINDARRWLAGGS
ncbi:hypothetical protein BGW36DRAFT_261421, partial [Talaromyces proteolyticus]